MRNLQDNFKTRKRSFISDFSICMTVPLTFHYGGGSGRGSRNQKYNLKNW